MNKIHLIMPMAGGGTRFLKGGYELPKPIINLQGKPFFYWAMRSLTKFIDVHDVTFAVLSNHIDEYCIDKKVREYCVEPNIVVIPEVLNGAVLTCIEAVKRIDDDLPILFEDCDHAFICNYFYDYVKNAEFSTPDAALLTFSSNNPAYSYAQFDSYGKVVNTVEKKVVSNQAICGAYYFKNKKIFLNAAKEYSNKCNYNEFFMSGVYNVLASHGANIQNFVLDEHITFGTPNEYQLALNDNRLERLA